jgi:hypothetical protein
MVRRTLRFPALDEWQNMSEAAQDAFLDRMELKQRRTTLARRMAIGGLSVTIVMALAIALAFSL